MLGSTLILASYCSACLKKHTSLSPYTISCSWSAHSLCFAAINSCSSQGLPENEDEDRSDLSDGAIAAITISTIVVVITPIVIGIV